MQVLNGEIATFLLVLPMFAVGAGLAFSTTRAWLIQRRFSGTSLVLRQSPVELGGRLRGEIRVLTAVPVERELTVRLSCLRRYQDRGRKERVLWQTESTVPRHLCQLTPTSASIPIDVPAAADQPATSGRRDHHARILWRLDVFGACSGPDFAAHFEVPVFGRVSERAAADASASGQPSPAPRWPNARALGIKIERRPNGYTWIFRRRRTPLAVWIAAGTLFLTLSAAGLLLGGAVLGAIMFGVPAGVGIRWTLDLWLTEHRITLDPRNLTLGRSGYRPEVIVIPRTEIHAVKAARSTQLDSGQLYYDLLVESVARSYTVASMLESAVAARLADEVMSALRPPS
jgi:hypothetical protein